MHIQNKILAKLIMAFHFAWIGSIIFSTITAVFFEWYRFVNFTLLGTTLISQLLFSECPLTRLEAKFHSYEAERRNDFKRKGFIAYYLNKCGFRNPPRVLLATRVWLIFAFIVVLTSFSFSTK